MSHPSSSTRCASDGLRTPLVLLLGLLLVLPAAVPAWAQGANPNQTVDPALYQALDYRMVGPHRGGRVTAVTGVRGQPQTYYMGSTGGGVWKTTNAGLTWNNVTDDYFQAGSMGALAVSEVDPNVIYAGTGSACVRGNVSTGIGVYKTTDAGESWEHVGLPEAGQIGAVEVHPRDPDLVYVAALGHPFGPNPERGVYRSRDGGESWEHVLALSDTTGAVDLSMDPANPRVVYAAMWRAERKPWTLFSGSAEGGVYKTADGGDTWTKLTNGLPEMTGRIGVSVSPARPDRVWALVEAFRGEAGLYRSDDAGRTWRLINDNEALVNRPWYYNHVDADPQDANTVYINTNDFFRSHDGGMSFEEVQTPHGDNHDMWINPDDNRIMIQGNDGGANVSFDAAESWSAQTNQPTAEFYTLEVDDAFPYRIYGPQQDNSTISVPSRVEGSGITIQRWQTAGGCETGPISVDPFEPDVIYANCYAGRLTRYDRRTRQYRQIGAYPEAQLGTPARELHYRFQWNAPVVASRHHRGVLYYGSQFVHRSTNGGQSWEVVSPDLTLNDTTKQGMAGEPITRDMTGVEIYATVFEIVESPLDPDALWVGSNDGLIHVSRDRGETWSDVTPEGLPPFSTVQTIDASAHAPGKAYAAVYRYRMDDFAPYVYRTNDYGESWERLTDGTNGIPADHPVRAIREDPDREGLLYAGTEFGMFVSFDDGGHWQPFQLDLPHTPITDLRVHQQDLVVATQGRSFWVLDDVTPLHELGERVAGAEVHLFQPRTTYRVPSFGAPGSPEEYVRDEIHGARLKPSLAGENRPVGAMIFYTLAEEPEAEVTLEVLDARGQSVRSFSSEDEGPDAVPTRSGMNEFVWDLRYPGVDGEVVDQPGPYAVPGTYQVRLSVGETSQTRDFEVVKDPRVPTTIAEFREQFELLGAITDRLQRVNDAVEAIRAVKEQVEGVAGRVDDGDGARTIAERADDVVSALTEHEGELVRVPDPKILGYSRPKLVREFGFLASMIGSAETRPTDQARERFDELDGILTERLERLREVFRTDVADFSDLLRSEGVGPIVVPRAAGLNIATEDGQGR